MIEIRDIREGDLPVLLELYNEQVSHLPNCRPVELAEFSRDLKQFDSREQLGDARIIVGEIDGEVAGFLHLAIGDFMDVYEEEQSGCVIFFFAYRTSYRRIGQKLLEAAEDHARLAGASRVWAFQIVEGYPFFGLGNVSDRMGHVCALLAKNGYTPNEEWVVLQLRDCCVDKPKPPGDEYEIALSDREPPRRVLELLLHGEVIGECRANPRPINDEVGTSFYISDLVVYSEETKGKGWGRYLLLQMLWEGQELGYRHSLVKTLLDNHTAQLLYTSVGYQVCDVSRGYRKNL